MRFSYSAVWADVMELLRSHFSLVATVAGVFIFLPNLLLGYFVPQPEPAQIGEIGRVMAEYLSLNWHWLLLDNLVNMVGAIAILLLIFSRGITVGGAIAAALAILPFYFATSILSGLLIGIGFVFLIVPGLYLLGRLSPIGALLVAENRRNPLDAIARCFELTKGRGWAVLGLLCLVAVAGAIVVGVAVALLALLFVLALGQDLAALPVLIVKSAGNAALVTLILLLNAAIYRQLSRLGSAPAAPAD
ncbi:MAG: hypothetical protein QOG72_3277 [Sphingomonadales bacterium]|jgi:hypothetical protein|nr:hypothetical protein [Sphingomonadales bacterium]